MNELPAFANGHGTMGPGRGVAPLAPQRADWHELPRQEGAGAALRQYWRMLVKRRHLILGCVGLALAIGVAMALLAKPMYAATSTIEIAREAAPVVEMDDAQPMRANDPEFYQTQYSLLASRSLAARVVDDLRLSRNDDFLTNFGETAADDLPETRDARRDMAIARVMDGTEIVPVRLSSIVDVRFNSANPDMAAKVANSLAQNFIDSTLARRYEASSYARNFLQERLNEIRQRLEESERQAVGYAGRNQLIDVAPAGTGPNAANQPPQSLVGATLAEANSALAEARANRIAAENRYRQASGQPVESLSNAALNEIRGQRAALNAQYAKLLSDFGPEYPAAAALAAQIRELDRQIAGETGRIRSTVSGSLRSQYLEAAANERQLSGLVEQLKGGVLDQRERSIQYNIYQRDVDTNRALYDALLQRYKEIGIAGGVGTNNVSIVDLAQVPQSPYSPNLPLNVILSVILGAALGAGLALLLEQMEDSAILPEEFEQKLGVPLLGSTPKTIADDRRPVEILADPKTPLSESYFSVLTGLRFSTSHGTPLSIVVTSTQAGEGKTTTSYALASNLARVGKRVLLIDFDLRNPSVHKINEVANEAGTSNLLIGEGSLEEYAHRTEVPNLDIVTAGPIPPNPAELLAGDAFEQLLQKALQHYGHVVVDAPPILGLADAPLLARVAEGTVFVMESGRTKASQARIAVKRLMAVNAFIIGAVLTKLDQSATGYGYGYGYDYEYGNEHRRGPKAIAG